VGVGERVREIVDGREERRVVEEGVRWGLVREREVVEEEEEAMVVVVVERRGESDENVKVGLMKNLF
jgi:hypothetical protein